MSKMSWKLKVAWELHFINTSKKTQLSKIRDIYVALCAGKNASVLVMAVPWVKFTTYQPLKTQNNLRVLQQGNWVQLIKKACIWFWITCESMRFSFTLRRWGSFARRNVCDSATKIPYWWRKICPESGQKRWLVEKIILHNYTRITPEKKMAHVPPRETSPAA